MVMGSNVANTCGGEEDPSETDFEQIAANFYDTVLVLIILWLDDVPRHVFVRLVDKILLDVDDDE